MASKYTLADLHAAQEHLAELEERGIGSERHSNPDSGRGALNRARFEVDTIRSELKSSGTLPETEVEKLWEELDRLFPNAQSKEVVEHNGRRYQRRFTASQKSRSGKSVTRWFARWEELLAK